MTPLSWLLAVATLSFLTACQAGLPDPTDEASPPPTLTSSTAPSETYDLTYSFSAGEILTYDVEITQRVVVASEAEQAATNDLPAGGDVKLRGTGRFTFEVADGPTPGTYRLSIAGEFEDLSAEGAIEGRPIEGPGQADQLGIGGPVTGEIVIDRSGRLTNEGRPAYLGSVLEISTDLARFPGPMLPTEPVAIGERWEVEHSEQALGTVPVETTVAGSLTGTEMIDGTEMLVIETDSRTGEAEVDLSTFYRDFLGGFSEEADRSQSLEDTVFQILIGSGSARIEALMDPQAGRLFRATRESSNRLSMEMALPHEVTGELESLDMRLETEDRIDYRLDDASGG